MKVDFLSQAGKLLKEQKQYRRRAVIFLCLAVIVGYGTVMALKLYGQAMTHKMDVLECRYEVHQHTEDCYRTDAEGNMELTCGYADYVVHTHNDGCYDDFDNLVCELGEHDVHEHTEDCYVTEMVLICEEEGTDAPGLFADDAQDASDGTEVADEAQDASDGTEVADEAQDASDGTEVADEAQDASDEAESADDAQEPSDGEESPADAEPAETEKVLVCGEEAHTHGGDCYEDALTCEAEEHIHDESCTGQALACAAEEHTHGEGCVDEEGNQTCGIEEHTHAEECYSEANICGKEEHTHGEDCHTSNLVCGMEEHEHTESCYETVEVPGTEESAEEPTAPAEAAEEDGAASETEEDNTANEAETEGSGEGEEEPEAETESETETEGHLHTEACYEEVTRLACGEQEPHIHNNSCYSEECFDEEGNLIEGSSYSCGLLQLEAHMHTEDEYQVVELTPEQVELLKNGAKLHLHEEECFDEEGNLICGHDATHVHMPRCFDDTGKVICGYGTASHVHEDKCYDEKNKLICGYETASHLHEESCYDIYGELQCGYETASHVHELDCYDEEHNLICGYATASHVHEESCYDIYGELQCGYETAAHAHKKECYDEDGTLICGYESLVHIHEVDCYDEENNLICGYEAPVHVHEETCYDENGELICGYMTAAHVHAWGCYDEDGNLICGYDTIEHEHEEDCYDEDGNLICGYDENGNLILPLYCEDSIHTHDRGCYDENENLVCGEADYAVHTHVKSCYGADEELICRLPEVEAHTHTDECQGEDGVLTCGKEEIQLHTHVETCYDEDGSLVCGQLEVRKHVHSAECAVAQEFVTKTYQGDNFIVTATYGRDANIPRRAELIAEQITEESDEEHYAKRQAEYQEALGDDKATMRALLKVGFYVNGEEVEPEQGSTVTITVQFLDENGLVEGKPITVIHFAEEGTEELKGSTVENGSTTFETGSFSEFAVGHGVENVTVPVDEVIEYETDDFHITFTFKGDASVPIDAIEVENNDGNGAEATEPEDGEGSNAGDVFTAPVKADGLEKDLEFQLEAKDEDSEEYAAVVAYGEEMGDKKGEELLLKVWSYSVNYNGMEVDLSDCKVTAEFTPTRKLVNSLKEAATISEEQPGTVDVPEGDGALGFTEEVAFSFMNFSTGAEAAAVIEEVQMADITDGTTEMPLLGPFFAARASGQPNPKFTVQYYANLDVIVSEGTNKLTLIDTSGKKLPVNGNKTSPTGAFKYMYVDNNGKVETVKELTKVYSERNFEYHKAPTINYMNALVENANYKLTEVWIYPGNLHEDSCYVESDGKKELICSHETDSHDESCYDEKGELKCNHKIANSKNDWEFYPYNGDLHFTNRKVSADGTYIYIAEGSVIRFVYDTTTKEKDFSAAFYDYDISNGRVHRAKPPENPDQYQYKTAGETFSGDSLTSEVINWANGLKNNKGEVTWDGHFYAYTKEQGINSSGNYSGSGTKLAFGNVNTGTNLGRLTWLNAGKDNEINKYNNSSYLGCTFGLVTGMSDGKIQYASNINAPKLFNEGDATGKESYDKGQYSLKFNRVGDTYTLTAVNGTGATELDSFKNPANSQGNYDGKHYNSKNEPISAIWTNNFWPMDSAPSFGTGTHDVKFGGTATFKGGTHEIRFGPITEKTGDYTFPESDDGKYHNSYFGMHYEVEFDLVKDYVGPLEYYFFGDDDMWVFLDGKLVCDIGGVHSSVGEYVNLWDYLDKGTEGKHKLSFFYTERGASGSTCWMQFTLPSVSSLTPETTDEDYGELRIEKTVTQVDNKVETAVDNSDEFSFIINLADANGKKLPDDYSYLKYDKDGNEIGHDLIIWDGGEFTLKNGEYIIIKYLPQGTMYTITEADQAITVIDNTSENSKVEYFTDITIDGTMPEGKEGLDKEKEISGNIEQKKTSQVKYNNKFYIYELPETGGSGTILYTMAGGIIVLFGAGLLYRKKFRERRG